MRYTNEALAGYSSPLCGGFVSEAWSFELRGPNVGCGSISLTFINCLSKSMTHTPLKSGCDARYAM